MINKELVEVYSEIAREKNVERSELGSIIEALFLHLVERERGESSNCSVIVNLDKGEFEIYVEKMIVDDIEDNRYTLERRLKRDGYTNLFSAEGGKIALEMTAENKFDLILLDLMMPDISGLEVLLSHHSLCNEF